MAETKTLARPYAEAVFDLARQRGELKQWSGMLQLLEAVAADARVTGLISDPRVTTARLAGLILDIGGPALTREGASFVRLLADNRRLGLLPEIGAQFERLRAEAEGEVEVEAVSAFELSAEQVDGLTRALTRKLNRKVRLATQVDRSLLGGVLIRVGDNVIDGSIKGRLRELSSQLNR